VGQTDTVLMGGGPSAWRAVVERLSHPDVWGPGGLFPLDAFRRSGRGWVARCPSGTHPDRHPSFSMPVSRTFGRCFACGYRRTWFGFVLERQGQPPDARGPAVRAALATLAERAGVPLDGPARSPDAASAPGPLFALAGILKQGLLSDHPRAVACRAYLATRGVPEVILPRLPLGAWTDARGTQAALRAARLPVSLLREHGLLARYVPHHPLLFLYEDADGVTGVKCRKPTVGEKSVLNALGFGGAVEGRSLFGLGVARETIARYERVIVVEGEFDALGWHAASFAVGRQLELVALGGSSKPTVEKFRTLRGLGARAVYLALDADLAGEVATATACSRAWEAGLEVAILPMPEGCKDPDEVLVRHGPVDGARRIFTLERAEPGARWLAQYHLRRIPPVTLAQAAGLCELAAEAARVMPPSGRCRYATFIGEALGVSPGALQEEWARHEADARARAVRDDVRRWAFEWVGRLDHERLADHLDEASRVLARARAELSTSQSRRDPGLRAATTSP
jgi:DNA primase